MNILISNDDGINAEGIKILAEEISKIQKCGQFLGSFKTLWKLTAL